MDAGYRRRILIEPGDGVVTAELEDDYHRMVVTLRHEGGVVRAVESEMKRSPWTLCPGAMEQLAQTFTGLALAEVARRGGKSQNCTHLYDLATWAAAHASSPAPIAYEVLATDVVDGRRTATLWRDGVQVFHWRLVGDRLAEPAELEGLTLFGLNDWIATLDAEGREAARVLRWATIVAHGRGMEMPAGMAATRFPSGSCFNFQPERAPHSFRRPGADIDFSADGREPMADRSASFLMV